ncbi:hypothetical protein HHL19_22270 [Streptomyces sp. R302]|uniref:hypothetical protein n=1 Tax=unclassified Streptomyces TaxID=2593676 RepID=UPI00145C56BC|nr:MULTISPECIES: hypothetical protein [unclassified Streptomyces]NML51691.1 hypothetical protein [Streptomyces sp. R301]NML81311.1 hypothetical protein [Streptomyces sp. R302]
MAHAMCGLVVAGRVDTPRAESVGLRAVLAHADITVFPIDHYFSAYWAAVRGNRAQLDLPPGILAESMTFPGEAVLHDLVREVTRGRTPRFAVVQTEYFAGTGDQWAAAFDGEVRLTPDGATINQALAALGVKAAATADEFDVIGLGAVRGNPDHLQAYAALCAELGV